MDAVAVALKLSDRNCKGGIRRRLYQPRFVRENHWHQGVWGVVTEVIFRACRFFGSVGVLVSIVVPVWLNQEVGGNVI